jgi:hypothetical protein
MTWLRSLLIFGFVFLAISSGCISYSPRHFSSRYSFEFQLVTNGSINNATFYIPLPVKESSPSLGPKILNASYFEEQGCRASMIQNPRGVNLVGSYEVSGSEPWFIDLMCNSLKNDEIYHIEITQSSALSPPLILINTRSPIGNESVILPKFNLTTISNATLAQVNPFHIIYPETRATQHTLMYADYSSPMSTEVSVYFSVKGYNQWLESYDAWQGNSYQEWFFWKNVGEFHGWTPVEGTIYTGTGIYPNPSNPEWQKLIRES